jgi:hypothetical protein
LRGTGKGKHGNASTARKGLNFMETRQRRLVSTPAVLIRRHRFIPHTSLISFQKRKKERFDVSTQNPGRYERRVIKRK